MNNLQKVTTYLKRIGYSGHPAVNFDTLHALQRQHLLTVPYENIDILNNIPISLNVDDIYDKVVTRRRGGYCFELNALFAWLLRELGFKVTDYMARFLLNEPEIPMRRHRVLSVLTADGQCYLCDVGVGLVIPRQPVPLVLGVENPQNGENYILEYDDFLGYVLHDQKDGEWRQLYSFTAEEQLEKDYIMPSFFCEKHPDSIFNKTHMVHIFTENGRKSVADRELKIFSPSGVDIKNPATEAEFKLLLLEHFGLIV